MKKVYLAHPISSKGEFTDSIRVAEEIEKLGFSVYAAARNSAINNKSNNPTAKEIYRANMKELLSSDVVVVNLTGGSQDGTVFELGSSSGWGEAITTVLSFLRVNYPEVEIPFKPIEVVAYTSNARALQPQFHKDVASGALNHLNLGGAEEWGEFVCTEENMFKRLEKIVNE